MKDDKLFLIHILERIKFIEDYTLSGRDAFMQSQMIQDAVMRNFEIIGGPSVICRRHFAKSIPMLNGSRLADFATS